MEYNSNEELENELRLGAPELFNNFPQKCGFCKKMFSFEDWQKLSALGVTTVVLKDGSYVAWWRNCDCGTTAVLAVKSMRPAYDRFQAMNPKADPHAFFFYTKTRLSEIFIEWEKAPW